MFCARTKDIEVISSLPGSPYFFFEKNGPVKHSNLHAHSTLFIYAQIAGLTRVEEILPGEGNTL